MPPLCFKTCLVTYKARGWLHLTIVFHLQGTSVPLFFAPSKAFPLLGLSPVQILACASQELVSLAVEC